MDQVRRKDLDAYVKVLRDIETKIASYEEFLAQMAARSSDVYQIRFIGSNRNFDFPVRSEDHPYIQLAINQAIEHVQAELKQLKAEYEAL